MTSESIIAIDAMSGDLGAEVVVHAVRKCLDKESDLHIILVGKEKELSSLVAQIIGKESKASPIIEHLAIFLRKNLQIRDISLGQDFKKKKDEHLDEQI